jgi:dTDP-4-dehydrorhamnose 3,5-epimerase
MPVRLVRPKRFEDDRGWFTEVYNEKRFAEAGAGCRFIQDNQSLSREVGTLRGLHFQTPPFAQAKLVRCIRGRVFDVAVDVRKGSPTWGKWVSVELSAKNGLQLFLPIGFAHGFVTLEVDTEVLYKVSAPYAPNHDGGIRWDDPSVDIRWPLSDQIDPILSLKDAQLPKLAEFDSPFDFDGAALLPLETTNV